MYDRLASFAQTGGLLLFVAAFVLVLIYALAPWQKESFQAAARTPINEPPEPDGSDDLKKTADMSVADEALKETRP